MNNKTTMDFGNVFTDCESELWDNNCNKVERRTRDRSCTQLPD